MNDTSTIERFAIRHKPSGNFLPITTRNHTASEPTADCVPRLFDSKRSATSALSRWLEGIWSISFSTGWDGEAEVDWEPEPVPTRFKSDMEVVPVQITIEVVK